MSDPKKASEPTSTELLAKMQELEARRLELEEQRQEMERERLELDRERHRGERDRQNREMPENKQAPGISAFSYPEGNLRRPKPELRCKTVWAGRELSGAVETPEEIDLLNRLTEGDYKVTKADGSRIPFQVRYKRDANENLTEVNIWFPCKLEAKHNHRSMISYCQQVLGVAEPTVDELAAEIARLKLELARNQVGIGPQGAEAAQVVARA